MRVISGRLKGRRLIAPNGLATRPTADRIKESVFNILGERVQAKHVLDLFAGTGALGIEALSRGAKQAIFIDRARAALDAIHGNIKNLGLEDRARVIQWDILKNLNCLSSSAILFDLVFMDPPYAAQAVPPALDTLVDCGKLAPGACIVIEHSARISPDVPTGSLTITDQRRFGKTLVTFMDSML